MSNARLHALYEDETGLHNSVWHGNTHWAVIRECGAQGLWQVAIETVEKGPDSRDDLDGNGIVVTLSAVLPYV